MAPDGAEGGAEEEAKNELRSIGGALNVPQDWEII
jgi:hypothetical protein